MLPNIFNVSSSYPNVYPSFPRYSQMFIVFFIKYKIRLLMLLVFVTCGRNYEYLLRIKLIRYFRYLTAK